MQLDDFIKILQDLKADGETHIWAHWYSKGELSEQFMEHHETDVELTVEQFDSVCRHINQSETPFQLIEDAIADKLSLMQPEVL